MFDSAKKWCLEHRKAIVITALGIGATVAIAYVVIKGRKISVPVDKVAEKIVPDLPEAVESMENAAVKGDNVTQRVRRGHIRHLHEGWKASPDKLAEAAARNIYLGEGETLVNETVVNYHVAA